MIEVKATDANTSVVLDDQLRPWNESEGLPTFGKDFSNRDEAREYCHTMLEQHPDVVFWMENCEPEQITKQDQKDKNRGY